MSPATKIFSIISLAFLCLLALGFSPVSLTLAKTFIFISAVYLFIISFRTKEKPWMVFFAAVVLLFNPAGGPVSLPEELWQFIDIVVAAGVAFFFYRYYDGYRKGTEFEKFVSSLFPMQEWAIEDWAKDKSKSMKRDIESDRNPDLTLRNIKTGERVAVECKFRSRPWTDESGAEGISWDAFNHDFYKRYGAKENIPVKVVFGIGGNPSSPERIFLVPLEKLEGFKGMNIPLNYLEDFEKSIRAQLTLQ